MPTALDALSSWWLFLPLVIPATILVEVAGSVKRQLERGERSEGSFAVAEVLFAIAIWSVCFGLARHYFDRPGATVVTVLALIRSGWCALTLAAIRRRGH